MLCSVCAFRCLTSGELFQKILQLQHRPSGGGGKLGTLDMQSYLEVMGRQLAEIQAQHHQVRTRAGDA